MHCAQDYIKFQRLACRAFLILRQHAAIVVNMFDLVSQDMFDCASAAPRLLERFQLNLSDDDAVLHMQQVCGVKALAACGDVRDAQAGD